MLPIVSIVIPYRLILLYGYAGHQRVSCDVAPWYYALGMVFLAIAAPLAPGIFGITALFLRYPVKLCHKSVFYF